MCFSRYLGICRVGEGGSPDAFVYNLLRQFFTLNNSKIEVFETYSFHPVITENDHPRYVKHVLGRMYVFFILFGYWVVGGGGVSPQGLVHGLPCSFHPTQLKNQSFPNKLF